MAINVTLHDGNSFPLVGLVRLCNTENLLQEVNDSRGKAGIFYCSSDGTKAAFQSHSMGEQRIYMFFYTSTMKHGLLAALRFLFYYKILEVEGYKIKSSDGETIHSVTSEEETSRGKQAPIPRGTQ